jgi:hypothetical protein
MSSRAHTDAAVERRVRRLAQRRGLSLLFAKKRNPKIDAHGGFMLRSDETMEIVFGNKGYEYSADIEEIEAFLEGDAGDA